MNGTRKETTMLIPILLTSAALADCMPLSLDEVSEQARVLMSQGEPGLALQKVDEAIESLPCRSELIRAEDLSELYQVGGTAARQAGDEARWRALYGRAAAMVFPVEFYGVLGDVDRQEYEDLLAALPQQPTASLTVQGPVFVDGYALQPGGDQGVQPGEHLVQELLADGSRRSGIVRIADGERVPVGTSGSASGKDRPQRKARVGLALAGVGLVVGGAVSLVEAGRWQESLGYNLGREATRSTLPDHTWTGFDQDTAYKEQMVRIWSLGGLAGITVGTAILGGAFVLSNDSITFTKTW